MGGRVRNVVGLCIAAVAWGVAACGGEISSGTPFTYHVVAEFDGGRGAEVLDFETVLTCDEWRGGSCVKAPSEGTASGAGATSAELVSESCECTGSYSIDFSGSGVSTFIHRIAFGAAAAAPGTLTATDNGLFTVVSGGSSCTGSVRVTKAGRLASDTPGYSYPDVAGLFAVSCPGFELKNGLFYLNPKEIELGLEK
ncbi:MAG: hypothetical protein HY897_23425 [Deltaproteobacteria bacterium]|nr:hypothetical protein [Deltaproteobacteria bacterium]